MNYLENLREIEEKYNYFIFDIWGVIHDGDSLYPNVLKTLKRLKSNNNKIYFLSNAPRRAHKARIVLNDFGIEDSLIDGVLTSGEIVYNHLKQNQQKNYNTYNKKFYYIGPQRDRDLLEGLDYELVNDPKEASFAIVTGFDDNENNLSQRKKEIEDVKNHNLTLICANPDIVVVKKSGKSFPCAGQIAQYYQSLGGKVIYFGKPHHNTYKELMTTFNIRDKKDMVVIGDGLETDILGANNYQIDSIFITSGIISVKLGNEYNEMPNIELLEKEINISKSMPKYIIKNL